MLLMILIVLATFGADAESTNYRNLAKFLGVATGTTIVLAARRAWTTEGKPKSDGKLLDPGFQTSSELQANYFKNVRFKFGLFRRQGMSCFGVFARAVFGRD